MHFSYNYTPVRVNERVESQAVSPTCRKICYGNRTLVPNNQIKANRIPMQCAKKRKDIAKPVARPRLTLVIDLYTNQEASSQH